MTYRLANLVGRALLALWGIRVRTTGTSHLPRSGPVILAMTHVGYLDFVLVEKAAIQRGRYVRFLCRADIWKPGPLAWAMDRMRHVPVDRTVPAHAYLLARRRLEEGEALGIFPEAGISYSFTVRALMPGVAALARATGAPVVPVAIWGSQRIWSVRRPVNGRQPRPRLRRGQLVDICFGAPMSVAATDDLSAWTSLLGARLTELLESLQRLPEHQPAVGEDADWHPAHMGGSAPDRLEAADLDAFPRAAVLPTWGPPVARTDSPGSEP
ncbi:putative Phospholipid/glycerol acyltransferase [metagenome]|uniref:Putative Phospholipid/glycerol acyltransferase n=1 Tax=metagenome TaxID=256318 RepID=A0A2P2C639_9ZZZZ